MLQQSVYFSGGTTPAWIIVAIVGVVSSVIAFNLWWLFFAKDE